MQKLRLRFGARHMCHLFGFSVFVAALMFVQASNASAATCTFASTGSNDFNTAGNWDCGIVPTAADDVVIPVATTTVLSAPATVASVLVNSSATLTTTGFDFASEGTIDCQGALVAGSGNTITVGSNFSFSPNGAFTPGSGTVHFSTSTIFGGHNVNPGSSGLTFNHVLMDSSRSLFFNAGGTITMNGSVTSTGVVNVSSGVTMTVAGNYLNSGAGSYLFLNGTSTHVTVQSTTTNSGMINPINGTLTVKNLVNTGTVSFGYLGGLQTGTLEVTGTWNNNASSVFSAGSSTVAYNSLTGATVVSTTYNNLSFLPSSGSGVFTLDASTTVLGNVTIGSDPAYLDLNGKKLRLGGNWVDNGVLVAGTGTVELIGSANQTISAENNFYRLDISKTSASATVSLLGNISAEFILLNGGILSAGTHGITLTGSTFSSGLSYMGGSFNAGTGTVTFQKTIAASVYDFVYYNLVLGGVSTYTLPTSSTVLGTLTVNSMANLDIGSATMTVVGTITNNSTITVSTSTGGAFIHRPESFGFTTAGFVSATSFTLPASLYLSVQDSNRNLNSSVAESFVLSVTNAAGDSEQVTLTETGASTGIFHSAALQAVKQTPVTVQNSILDMPGTALAVLNYVDPLDATDASTTSATLTAPASFSSNSSSGGGGGGGGSSGIVQTPTVFQTTAIDQKLLDNLKALNIPIHGLVRTTSNSAVYYIGADGKRHAFPNEKVYFTWYCDFSLLKTITDAQLATIPLGANVSYRPGFKMVKFTTDPKVYAVTLGGVLRHVPTEELAKKWYGPSWNKWIDDVSDAFYVNYTFGEPLSASDSFAAATEMNGVTYPGDTLKIPGVKPTTSAFIECSQLDADQDGLSDGKERNLGTDPTNADTDGDGYSDAIEVMSGNDPFTAKDTDGDGLSDVQEKNVYKTNPSSTDTDGDTYLDGDEVKTGHDPLGSGLCKNAQCTP